MRWPAVEIALWDIKGKVEGKPIWRLLGGEPKESVEAYAGLFRLHDPEIVSRIAATAHQRSYRRIVLHGRTAAAIAAARPRRAADGRRQPHLASGRSDRDGAEDAAVQHNVAGGGSPKGAVPLPPTHSPNVTHPLS